MRFKLGAVKKTVMIKGNNMVDEFGEVIEIEELHLQVCRRPVEVFWITTNDEMEYKEEMENLLKLSQINNLALNISKLKELVTPQGSVVMYMPQSESMLS